MARPRSEAHRRLHPRGLAACLVVLACTLGGAAHAQQCEPQRAAELYPQHARTGVKIATVTTSPPFAFADPASFERMTGAEVDVMQAVMQCAGLRFE